MDTNTNTSTQTSIDNAVAQSAAQVSKQAAATSVEAAAIASEAKADAVKTSLAEKAHSFKEKLKNEAAKHNVDLDAIKEKAKKIAADGLEGTSHLAEKLSGAAHNASQKLSHQS